VLCAHDHGGKFVGALTKDRAIQLLDMMLPTGADVAGAHAQPTVRSYADELTALLVRGKHLDTSQKAPAQAWEIVRTALAPHAVTERYTTALTRDPHFAAYCSLSARDAIFGSMGGPTQTLWAGINFAVPPVDNRRSLAAVRHAVCSAIALQTQQQGSLSILLLQAAHGKDIPGYHAWLERSPHVLPLATFRAGQTAQTAAHWYTAPPPKSTLQGSSTWLLCSTKKEPLYGRVGAQP
jgi:hypothetical protein